MMVHEEAVSAGTEAQADEALVERTIKLLSEHDPKKAESVTAVGEHVLDAYFGGDATRARSKKPAKDKSFARLAERTKEEKSLKKRSLYRAAALAAVGRSLSPQLREGLEPAQLEELGAIDDVAKRREIAARVAAGELKGKALRAAIANAGKEAPEVRAPEHAAEKMSAAFERALDELEKSGELGKRKLKELGTKSRRGLGKRLRTLAKRLGTVAKQLEA